MSKKNQMSERCCAWGWVALTTPSCCDLDRSKRHRCHIGTKVDSHVRQVRIGRRYGREAAKTAFQDWTHQQNLRGCGRRVAVSARMRAEGARERGKRENLLVFSLKNPNREKELQYSSGKRTAALTREIEPKCS
jgi:hypothetical protein